ncbi:hypothetical protein LSAT2_008033 [Lamellibrachia satsuma]|nr:hypothetical protein LSAT2_008033 [Lamellibrachia satsuma]
MDNDNREVDVIGCSVVQVVPYLRLTTGFQQEPNAHTCLVSLPGVIWSSFGQCDDEVRIYNGTRLMATLCNAHVVKRQTHIFYVEGDHSALVYRTASGQLGLEPDRGFWLSFRQVDVIPSDANLRYFDTASSPISKSLLTTVAPLIGYLVIATLG